MGIARRTSAQASLFSGSAKSLDTVSIKDPDDLTLAIRENWICALTGETTGGCDHSSSCVVALRGMTNKYWVVEAAKQDADDDCDFSVACDATCWETQQIPTP